MAKSRSEPSGNAVDPILAEYRCRLNQGEQVDREQFIADHPAVADELRVYFSGGDAAGGGAKGATGPLEGPAAVQTTPPPESGGPVTHSQNLFTSETTGYPLKPILGGPGGSDSPAGPLGIDQVASFLNSSGLLSPEKVNDLLSRASQEGNSADAGQMLDELRSSGRLTQFQCDAIRRGQGLQLILGNYVLMDQLGRGGMGQVFQAWHRKMDRVVALKTLRLETMNSAKAVERFHREVKTAARLTHPNIVTAHDADESGGVHFLVMEHVAGSDLADHIRQHGPARVSQAADWIIQAARGLNHAHLHGIIHRDIKPGNLLLGNDGTVKVLDMGLARLEERLGEEAAVEALTQTGDVLGTLDYMAPEQAEDTAQADTRADIYSLGCTLFYLLTGRAVYGGHTAVKKILAHREEPVPSLTEVRRDVPEQIDALFRRMVAKAPADRPASMGEVIAELEPFVVAASTANEDTATFQGPLPQMGASGPAGKKADAATPSLFARRRRAAITLAVVLFVALPIFTGIFVLRMSTPEGTLVVEVSHPGATVEVVDPAGTVKVTDTSGEGPLVLSVQPGEHRVKVIKDGFEFFAQDVTITRRGEQTVRAVLESKGGVKPSGPAAPVREPPLPPWSLPSDAPAPAIAPFDAAQARKHQEAWAEHRSLPLEVTNSIGMKFVLIPPGEFMMGSTEEEVEQFLKEAKERQEAQWYINRLPAEAPRHRVRITRPFYLGLYEVTQAEYQQVMGSNPSHFSAEGKEAAKVTGLDTSRHPVEAVSWNDAKAFCEKLSAMPEEQTAGRVYVLPTEAQWEYACRASTATKWSCGDDEGVLRDYAWFNTNSGGRTRGVGERKPNAFGLFDMHGNVWEWCADWHAADYYAASPVDDPQGPASGSYRVLRGGCWGNFARGCRSAYRYRDTPVRRYSVLGFRLALVPADESSK